MAERWWDEDGPMGPLLRMNPVRVGYIKDAVAERLKGLGGGEARPLAGVRALDVGCGAGILAEPLARLGAKVTGIDPTEKAIEAAREHCRMSGLTIDYRVATTGDLVDEGVEFDLVVASEVIEHVPDQDNFVRELSTLATPAGLVVVTTLNKTPLSFVKAIVGAEYVLGWLPRGTHDWRKFVKPSLLARLMRAHGLSVLDVSGIGYNPATGAFSLSRLKDTNYILSAQKLG